MGILSMMNRNLLSKIKPFSSSNLRFFSAPTVPFFGDSKPRTSKPMFVIERFDEVFRNFYTLLSAADHNKHHSFHNPFSDNTTRDYHIIVSCNELTLFVANERDKERDSNQRRLSLWNPTTNRTQTIPLSLLPRPVAAVVDINCFGFGFDPKSQDYKLVSFLQFDYFGDSFGKDHHVELYSLKTDTWKQIAAPPPGDYPLFHAVHVNGVHYWDTMGPNFLSFDFVDEKFSLIPRPKDTYSVSKFDDVFGLAEYHGSLAALVHPDTVEDEEDDYYDYDIPPLKEDNYDQKPFSFELWVWNGETWSITGFTIGDDVLAGDRVHRVLGLFLNDYLFLQGQNEGELMLFNLKTGKLENLGTYAGLKTFDCFVCLSV